MIRHALWAGLQFQRNQRSSPAALAQRKLARFRRFAAWVRDHSPYYRQLMAAQGIDPARCLPEHFPELTKRLVIEHFDQLVTSRELKYQELARFVEQDRDPGALYRDRYHVVQSSGTSGEIGIYVFRPEEWMRGLMQSARLGGKPRWRKRIAFVGATRGHYAGVSAASSARGLAASWCDMRAFDVGAPLAELVAQLNAFRPVLLSAYATILAELARAQERGELRIAPEELISGGEALREREQQLIERVFGAPVANVYMSSEHLVMGFVPPRHDGMILCEDDLIYECQDDHVLVTNLFNRTLPLIRYRMNDVLMPLPAEDAPHPAFPAYRRVRPLVGRQEQVPYFRNDRGERDFLHPLTLDELFVPGLELYQLQLVDERRFIFRARLSPELSEAERARVLNAARLRVREVLAAKEMSAVSFDMQCVEALGPDPRTGKFRLICAAPEITRSRPEASPDRTVLRGRSGHRRATP